MDDANAVRVEPTYAFDDFRTQYRRVLLHDARGTALGYAALAATAATPAVVASFELAAGADRTFPVVASCAAAAIAIYLVTLVRASTERTPRRDVAAVDRAAYDRLIARVPLRTTFK